VAPPDDRHLRKYGLTRETAPANPMPIDLGSDWYETWFHPWVDAQGNSWLVKPGTKPSDWGEIAGGHAYCINPIGVPYSRRWWRHYHQQRQDCTAYSSSIYMSLVNRVTYDPRPVYDYTLLHDEFPGEADNGTTLRSTFETIMTKGEVLKDTGEWSVGDGVAAYRWCGSPEEMYRVLDPVSGGQRIKDRGYVIKRGTWGPSYPYAVRIPLDVIKTVIFDRGWGDCVVATDR